MQIRAQHQSTPTRAASCEPMEVQAAADLDHNLAQSGPSQKSLRVQNRTITSWRAVTVTVDQKAGIYQADRAIFSREITILPYDQLVAIARLLQQTAPNDANTQSNRVTSKPSPIDGLGAFAKRRYQQGEIIGFYTGQPMLRKPMPPRLHNSYRQLSGKTWQDIALPLYSIWRQNRAGQVQYYTKPDTYIAWSQVKIYNKGIELGIDGEHSGNPLRLLNHSHTPNTMLLPTVNPKMLQSIRADGQTYVKADSDLSNCLLIPVLAQTAIAKDEELTFHYQGYDSHTGYYMFDNTGKDIVSNPDTMMIQNPGEFPDFIKTTQPSPFGLRGRTSNPSKGKKPAPHRSQQSTTEPALSTDRLLRSTSKCLLSQPLSGPRMVLCELSIPLSPIRLWGESDQDFAQRRDQLVNRPDRSLRDISPPATPDTIQESDGEQSHESDGETEDQLSAIDQHSDMERIDSEEEFCPFAGVHSEDDWPLNLDGCPESQSFDLPKDDSSDSSELSGQLPQKRPAPGTRKRSIHRQTNTVRHKALLQHIQAAPPHEYPEIIWNLFSFYLTISDHLLACYQRLCNNLNAKAIPHAIDGEAPEWTPALAYHYFVSHGYIDLQNATERYRLMPFSVLKERVVRCQNDTATWEVERFCLEWLRQHYFRCRVLISTLHLYRLNQQDGRQWDLPAVYQLLKAHPLSRQELMAWQAAAPDARTLGLGLWHLIRSGDENALHSLIRHYCLTTKINIRTMLLQLNRGFDNDKGLCTIGFPLSPVTLFKYIIENDILDLHDRQIFHRLLPYQTAELITLLTPAEKNKLLASTRDTRASEITFNQIKDKLLREYITDHREHRVLRLAKNLLQLFLVESKEADKRKVNIYRKLVSLLTRYQIDSGCYPKWSKQAIYDFWLCQNVLDETTQYQVMDFSIFKNRLDSAAEPEKYMAHYFQSWIKTQQPMFFLRHLAHYGITYKGGRFSIDHLFSIMDKYNIPYREKDLDQYKADQSKQHDRSLVDLPRRIRQYKDKAALKIFIEQWLSRAQHRKQQGLAYVVRQLKAASIGKNNSKETLKQFREAFQAQVWTTEGLFQFITNEGMIDFSKPENFCYLSPGEAGRFLPDAYCLDYARYAITLGKPAIFLSGWQKRCQNRSANVSPSAFYDQLARHLLANPPRWPYTHEQIKSKYDTVCPSEMHQLQTLLRLETIQYQAGSGYGQAPDSLLVLIHLLRGKIAKCRGKALGYLKNFQIKIPRDAECPVAGVSSPSLSNTQTTTPKGRAGTVHWTMDNARRLLARYDQNCESSRP